MMLCFKLNTKTWMMRGARRELGLERLVQSLENILKVHSYVPAEVMKRRPQGDDTGCYISSK